MSDAVVTCITTCKGRLAHLKQSLPSMTQPGSQAIIVDYGCPDGAGDWVQAHQPQATLVRINDDPGFHLARARNLGAAQATTPWLFFIDADMVLTADFFARVIPRLKPGGYYLASPAKPNTWGTCIVQADVFRRIGGYDEAIHGYGGEDTDLYERMDLIGVRRAWFPIELIRPLDHADEERTRYYEEKNIDHITRQNHLYRTIKMDLLRLTGRMPALPQRMELRRITDDAVRRARDQAVTLNVPIPGRLLNTRPKLPDDARPRLKTVLRYEVQPGAVVPANAPGSAHAATSDDPT